jgi:chromosome segregation ATPase
VNKLRDEAERIARKTLAGMPYASEQMIRAVTKALLAFKGEEDWEQKYKTLNKELMSELRDPNGTIWEHAKFLQDKCAELEKKLHETEYQLGGFKGQYFVSVDKIKELEGEIDALIKERDLYNKKYLEQESTISALKAGLERLDIECQATVCDCGSKLKEWDIAMLVKELLSTLPEKEPYKCSSSICFCNNGGVCKQIN